jgi:hypothetical protein
MIADPATTAAPAAVHPRPASAPAPAPHPPRRRRWWRRKRVWVPLTLVVALYFAPLGVARYLQSHGLTLTALDGTRFRIRADSVSLGWFSPVLLGDVRIADEAGQPLLSAPQITSQRSLAALAAYRSQPGRFFIEQPNLNVVVRKDGSNVEDFLSIFDRKTARGRARALSIGGTITQGLVSFTDANGKPLVRIDEIDCRGQQRQGTDFEVEVDLNAHIVSDGERRQIKAALRWEGPSEGLPFLSGVGTAGIKFDPLPLSILQPHLARLAPTLRIDAGTLSGQILIESDFRKSRALMASGEFVSRDVQGLRSASDGEQTPFAWDREELLFHVDGNYTAATDALQVERLEVMSTPLSISATGTVDQLRGECLLDVGGDVQYDINNLVQSLAGDSARHVQIEGLRMREFQMTGPLATIVGGTQVWDLSRLNLEAQINWDRADMFGIRSDEATIITRLHEGTLHIDPQQVPVSGGSFRAQSMVALTGIDAAARFTPGPALEDVEFSEQMCRLWLKYLSPVLADATRVNGRFSIDLQEGHVPLRHAAAGRIAGTLDVDSASVRPGPFAEQMIGIITSIRSLVDRRGGRDTDGRQLVTMQQQSVGFEMADGRVRHDPMTFVVAGATVHTSGSVGLDETLDLLIEVPLEERWFRNDLLASTLGGEVIRIPVRGTLSRPQFELGALRDLTRRFAAGAAGNLLQKLFD